MCDPSKLYDEYVGCAFLNKESLQKISYAYLYIEREQPATTMMTMILTFFST